MRICIGNIVPKYGKLIGFMLVVFVILISVSAAVDASPEKNKSIDSSKAISASLNQSVLNEHGPDWDDYLNPDGSHTRKIYLGQRNYWNGSGYEPIDTSIIEENGAFKVEKGAYRIYWSSSRGFKFNKDDYYFTYQWKEITQGRWKRTSGSISEVKGQKNKNKIKFKGIYPSTDIEYIYYPALLKENIILNKAPDMPIENPDDTLDFSGYVDYSNELEIWANGAKQEASFSTSGAIEFRSGEKTEFTLPPPIIEDAHNSSIPGEYEVTRENGKTLLSIRVPYKWLVDPARAYPVIVDPIISIRNSGDTFVNQASPGTNYGSQTYLEIQSLSSSNERVLLRVPLTSIPKGSTISSARLQMYAVTADTGRTIDAYSVDDYWYEYTVTWTNQPPHVSKIASQSSGLGWVSWTITSAVQNMITNKWGYPLYVKLMDSAESSSSRQRQQYYSWEFANNNPNLPLDAHLEVDYTEPQNDCNLGGDASNTFSGANSISVPTNCNGYVDSSDVDDYYKFSVTSGYKIDVSLTSPSGANFDLYLYDPANNQKASSTSTNPTDSVSFIADSSGDWRIKVHQLSGYGTYSLSVTVTQPPQNDCGLGGDASNTFSGANLISLPKNCNGFMASFDPSDYYRFPVTSGYTIDASMTPPSGVDFDLQLYDPGNNWKTDSNRGAGLTDSVSYVADSSGDWRVRIYYFNGSGTYSFSVSVADKTPPSVSISSPVSNSVLTSSTVQVMWSGGDAASGINRYEIQLDNGGWTNKGTATSHTFYGVSTGTHTIYVKAVDNAANTATASVTFTVQLSLPDLSISPEDITFEAGGI